MYKYKNLSTSRGDGNVLFTPQQSIFYNTYKNLSTSRGDGNMRFIEILSIDIKYKNLSTSRGDGNRLTSQRLNLQLTCKTTYSPREGTETKILR